MKNRLMGTGTLGPGDGTDGDDLLQGGSGNDTLAGLGGNDTLDGGSGDDLLRGGAGDDSLVGGDGFDRVDYSDATSTVIAHLTGANAFGGAGSDVLAGIEGVIGGAFNDSIVGNDSDNWIRGGAGDDTLLGGAGNDTADYADATGGVVAWLSGFVSGGAGSDTLYGFENLDGSAFSDELRGDDTANLLRGLDGDDTLRGEGGSDTLVGGNGADRLEGGAGADRLDGGAGGDAYLIDFFSGGDTIVDSGGSSDVLLLSQDLTYMNLVAYRQAANLIVELRNDSNGDAVFGTVTIVNDTGAGHIERVTTLDLSGQPLTDYALSAGPTGGAGADFMPGTSGADTLVGGGGADRLFGYLGADRLDGGSSDDQLDGDAGNDLLLGGSGRDALTGAAGDDTLDGGLGLDTLSGGAGADIYVVNEAADRIVEDLNRPGIRDLVRLNLAAGPGNYILPEEIEDLQLEGTAAQDGIGNTLNNRITGNASANFLYGGLGVDTLLGGGGNDTYRIDDPQDVVVEAAGGGTDTVLAAISYRLGANLERLDFSANTGALNGTGNELANTLIGTASANVLDGGTGADTLIGGLGADLYVVDNPGDVLIESPFNDIDTVRSSVSFTLGADLERLVLTGSTAINGTGNTLANRLTGNAAANRLDGAAGADTLVGGGGNDLYVVDHRLDGVLETSTRATEIDTVRSSVSWTLGANLERLTLAGSTAINGSGNALDNRLTGNTAANRLSGAAGADTLSGSSGNDTLVGGAGNDSLTGGAGSDLFRFDAAPGTAAGIDRLADFSVIHDTIQLENAVFTRLTTTGGLAAANFRAGAAVKALDANDYLLYDTASGALWYDADGGGGGAAVQIAWLTGTPMLSHLDFVVT